MVMDSRRLRRRLKQDGQRGLFIDCGSNLGQAASYFSGFYSPDFFDFILIEPNPFCAAKLRTKLAAAQLPHPTELIEAAASGREGREILYGLGVAEGGAFSVGASIVKEHNSRQRRLPETSREIIYVRTISFSELIKEKASRFPCIVVKMDIEGAECEVLESMLAAGTHKFITTLYVEFHSQYFALNQAHTVRERELRVLERLWRDHIKTCKWI